MVELRKQLTTKVSLVALPVFKSSKSLPDAGLLDEHDEMSQLLRPTGSKALRENVFTGKAGEVLPAFHPAAKRIGGLVLVGLGEKDQYRLDALRRAAGSLARRLTKSKATAVALPLDGRLLRDAVKRWGGRAVGEALADGWITGTYVYDAYKTGPSTKKQRGPRFVLLSGNLGRSEVTQLRVGVERGCAIGEGVNFARDLGNAPPNALYPESLASRARELGRAGDLKVRVLGLPELRRLKMGGLLGVSQGSARPPRLIEIHYRPKARAKKRLALVGKAITFDSGGLSLKPAKSMEEMKFDMCGGAAVLGAMKAIARLRPAVEVVGLVPASENLVNGSAMRPGDIIRAASGTTIEVLNTDAEGRLVLADALHYAQRFEPDCMLDFATLTGAVVVALGTQLTGLVSNDDALTKKVCEGGERCGERVWELPLYDEFVQATRSQVADIRNSCGRNAGAITAGAFLSHFVGEIPWCHLDIAGTAWTDRDTAHASFGATGVGVRLVGALLDELL